MLGIFEALSLAGNRPYFHNYHAIRLVFDLWNIRYDNRNVNDCNHVLLFYFFHVIEGALYLK